MSKFKVGDFFRRKGENEIYQVRYVKEDWVSGDTAVVSARAYPESEVERIDPKTAFIAELKGLLAKYDASIYPNGCVVDGIGFKVGNEDIYYNMNYGFGDFITADNIHDYDKEEV